MQSSVVHLGLVRMGIGPAGIRCPCCMPYQDKKQLRKIARKKITKQVSKLAIEQLLSEER